jgi:hypothetical protein
MSLLRVVYVARMDITGLMYAPANLAVWFFLEPYLGIINASLPILRPTGSRIFNSPALEWSRSSVRSSKTTAATALGRKASSGWTRSKSKQSQSDSLDRLEDPTDQIYQLDTIKTNYGFWPGSFARATAEPDPNRREPNFGN